MTRHGKTFPLTLPAMIRRVVSMVFIVLVAAGCKSRPLGPYTSPRVMGRVLAADTRQPLAGVRVTRGSSRAGSPAASPPKGGELMMREAPVRTDRDGRFVLASERVLSIIRGANWDVVSLSFDREGYQHFETNCPAGLAGASVTGEPVLEIGQICLQPQDLDRNLNRMGDSR